MSFLRKISNFFLEYFLSTSSFHLIKSYFYPSSEWWRKSLAISIKWLRKHTGKQARSHLFNSTSIVDSGNKIKIYFYEQYASWLPHTAFQKLCTYFFRICFAIPATIESLLIYFSLCRHKCSHKSEKGALNTLIYKLDEMGSDENGRLRKKALDLWVCNVNMWGNCCMRWIFHCDTKRIIKKYLELYIAKIGKNVCWLENMCTETYIDMWWCWNCKNHKATKFLHNPTLLSIKNYCFIYTCWMCSNLITQ